MSLEIATAKAGDIAEICDLLNLLIDTPYTYAEKPQTLDSTKDWLIARQQAGLPVRLASLDGQIIGLASYTPFRSSSGYRFTVEHSVYVQAEARGKGVAQSLLDDLILCAKNQSVQSLIGALDSENIPSLKFHLRYGFYEVGRIPHAGFKQNQWRTLLLLQYPLWP